METDLCGGYVAWRCRTTAGTFCPPPSLLPLPPPPDPLHGRRGSTGRAAAGSGRSARPRLHVEHTHTHSFTTTASCIPANRLPPSSRTFLGVLDDLPDGFLQAVGSQHELLSGFEDRSGGHGSRADARRARGVVGGVMEDRRRGLQGLSLRWRPLSLLLLLGNGGWRAGVRHGGGLGLLIQGLQQRVQLLLQHAALAHKQGRVVTQRPRFLEKSKRMSHSAEAVPHVVCIDLPCTKSKNDFCMGHTVLCILFHIKSNLFITFFMTVDGLQARIFRLGTMLHHANCIASSESEN